MVIAKQRALASKSRAAASAVSLSVRPETPPTLSMLPNLHAYWTAPSTDNHIWTHMHAGRTGLTDLERGHMDVYCADEKTSEPSATTSELTAHEICSYQGASALLLRLALHRQRQGGRQPTWQVDKPITQWRSAEMAKACNWQSSACICIIITASPGHSQATRRDPWVIGLSMQACIRTACRRYSAS